MEANSDPMAPLSHSCDPPHGRLRVNGVRIDPLDPAGYLSRVQELLTCGRAHVVHFCAAHTTVEARSDPAYRAMIDRGDMNLPDGAPVAWALALQGVRARRLAGTEGLHALASWGVGRGLRHYFYGSTPDVLFSLRSNLEATYPDARIVGLESPPFRPVSDEELSETAGRIRAAAADAVWIGLGTPQQDVVAERLRALDAAPLLLCVGAAFDFVAGSRRRAPEWMRRTGLEWTHRLASEPARLWRRYLIGNPKFVAGVLRDRLFGRGD